MGLWQNSLSLYLSRVTFTTSLIPAKIPHNNFLTKGDLAMCTYELNRCYFKQGDDFNEILQNNKVPSEALKEWSKWLKYSADYLEILSKKIENTNIGFGADCHMVYATGCVEKLKELASEGLLERVPDCDSDDFENCTECDFEGSDDEDTDE
jgi:hypothetical protein